MKKKEIIRKFVVYGVYIIFLSALQVSFSDSFSINGQVADLMLVFVILTGYLFGLKDAIAVGLITGLLRDYYAGPAFEGGTDQPVALLGLGMLLMLYAGVISSVLFTKAFHRKLPLGFVQVMIVTVSYKVVGHVLFVIMLAISGRGSEYLSLFEIVTDSLIPQMIVNLLATAPILLMLRYMGPYKNGINKRLLLDSGETENLWRTN